MKIDHKESYNDFGNQFVIDNKIDVIFNTAAYKHVPLVELNPLQGLKNNIFSTYVICSKSVEYKIDQMIQQCHH